jgi:hypothetical protein
MKVDSLLVGRYRSRIIYPEEEVSSDPWFRHGLPPPNKYPANNIGMTLMDIICILEATSF